MLLGWTHKGGILDDLDRMPRDLLEQRDDLFQKDRPARANIDGGRFDGVGDKARIDLDHPSDIREVTEQVEVAKVDAPRPAHEVVHDLRDQEDRLLAWPRYS